MARQVAGDYEAVLEKGYEHATWWHVVLDLMTIGTYGRMRWGLTGGTKQKTVLVDEYGNVQ